MGDKTQLDLADITAIEQMLELYKLEVMKQPEHRQRGHVLHVEQMREKLRQVRRGMEAR